MKTAIPLIIQDVGFDFDWNNQKLWALREPAVEINIDELLWHFNIPFWDKEDTGNYNLTPWEVIRDPEKHAGHAERVRTADVSHPVDIMENKGRLLILDGLHRLVKLYLDGNETVKVRKIPRSRIPEITE